MKKNVVWSVAGNLYYAFCQWLILLVIAKLGGPLMVGQFSLGLVMTAPIIIFFNFSLRLIQATDTKQEYTFREYVKLRLWSMVAALAVIVLFAFISGYDSTTVLIISFIGIAKAFEATSEVYYGKFQKEEKMDIISKSMFLKGTFSIVCVFIGVYITGSVLWGTVGLAVAWLSVLFFYDSKKGRMTNTEAEIQTLPEEQGSAKRLFMLVRKALPLGIVSLLISVNLNIPRYVIENQLGTYELGIFSAIAYFMLFNSIPINAVGQSASSRLSRYYVEHVSGFRKLLSKLAIFGLLFGSVGIALTLLAGNGLLHALYGKEFAEQDVLLVWLMVAATIGNVESILWYGVTAAQYFKVQLPVFICVNVLTLISCVVLVPRYGLIGAAVSVTAVAFIQLLMTFTINVYSLRTKRKSSASQQQGIGEPKSALSVE
ncbi:lipopolysaccharide biosynthesis protein [Paenibacillus sp. MBLB4367]|uniref:lipopolysaccharide biosynthesis protein n=1 Tax=Paenibacillus sp. MBLB4367 TaxID=3384767 RepID=UPI0039082750